MPFHLSEYLFPFLKSVESGWKIWRVVSSSKRSFFLRKRSSSNFCSLPFPSFFHPSCSLPHQLKDEVIKKDILVLESLDQVWIQDPLPTSCMTWGKLFNFAEHLFLIWKMGWILPAVQDCIVWIIGDDVHCTVQNLAQRKHWVNGSCVRGCVGRKEGTSGIWEVE